MSADEAATLFMNKMKDVILRTLTDHMPDFFAQLVPVVADSIKLALENYLQQQIQQGLQQPLNQRSQLQSQQQQERDNGTTANTTTTTTTTTSAGA